MRSARPMAIVLAGAMLAALVGCGGGGSAPGPAPPGGNSPATVTVGPMVVRPASTAGFVTQTLETNGDCMFVALHGARIDYLASRALLDRIAFVSDAGGPYDIWTCDMWGGNLSQITSSTAQWDSWPTWSPDGGHIAFERQPTGGTVSEIMVVNAEGGGLTNLTNNAADDEHPTWSPDGERIAFATNRTGDYEIYVMHADGSTPTNLSNRTGPDTAPDWCPNRERGLIAFDGSNEIFVMSETGADRTQLTNNGLDEDYPAWHPGGDLIAAMVGLGTGREIVEITVWGTERGALAAGPGDDMYPSYSTSGRYLAWASFRSGAGEVWVLDTLDTRLKYRIPGLPGATALPDLGAPTMQTDRVLLGPAKSDRGHDPVWASAYAGIVAYDTDGYRNFVRIGVYASDLPGLTVTPLEHTGNLLTAVEVSADEIVNLREDSGAGFESTNWYFGDETPGAALLVFNTDTGRLTSVLVTRDSAYPSAAPSPAATLLEADGLRTRVAGSFAAVYDDQGALVAESVGTVEFEGARLVRAF